MIFYKAIEDWRETGRTPKFFLWDWRLVLSFVLIYIAPFNIKTYTIILTIFVFFFLLNRKGYNIPNFFRSIQRMMIGEKASGKPFWLRRKNQRY